MNPYEPILKEVANGMLEVAEIKQNFSNNAFIDATLIFQTVLMDKLYDNQNYDKMKFDDNNEVVKGIFSSTKELDLMIVAHNAPYDRGVLANYTGFDEYADKWLCTMRIAKRLYMDDESVTQYNLPYLRYRFELVLPRDLDHHRASADCIITATLLEYLMGVVHERGLLDDSKPYKEQIIEWSRQPVFIPKMQFGKHAGQKWEEIPTDYIKWAINNLDCLRDNNPLYDPDMEFTITQVISERLYP